MKEPYATYAKKAGEALKLPWQWIYAQWALETGDFTSSLTKNNNNLAGITRGGEANGYRKYGSLDEFTFDYIKLLADHYPKATGAGTVEDFVAGLKAGGYFTDTLDNYTRGVKGFLSEAIDSPVVPGGEIRPSTVYISPLENFWAWARKKVGLDDGKSVDGSLPVPDEIKARQWAGLSTGELEEAWKNSPAGQEGPDFGGLLQKALVVVVGIAALVAGVVLMTKSEGLKIIKEAVAGNG